MSNSSLPVRLGHLVPERRPVVISRTNPLWLSLGEDDPRRAETPELVDVILQAYVFGPRCPGVVKAELASIEEAYQRALNDMGTQIANVEQGGIPTGTASFVVAWHTFLRETIQALVPGLTTGEADVLASVPPGEEGEGTELLRSLGAWTQRRDDPAPEAVGEETPTTAPSSPS